MPLQSSSRYFTSPRSLIISYHHSSDQRACTRVSGIHGPAGVWEKTRSDHHAEEARHSGSSEETHQGKSRFMLLMWSSGFTLLSNKSDVTQCLQQKRKLRIFISNTFNPAKPDAEDGEGTVASWELRVEGRLLEDVSVNLSSRRCLCEIWILLMISVSLTDRCVQVWSH